MGFLNISGGRKNSHDPSCSPDPNSSSGTLSGYFRSQILCVSDGSPAEETTIRVIYTESDSSSFYLKMGALSFAIGSMIYACLELGVFAENRSCFNTIMGVNPVLFICFIILQLYFIFLNSRVRQKIFLKNINNKKYSSWFFNFFRSWLFWNTGRPADSDWCISYPRIFVFGYGR